MKIICNLIIYKIIKFTSNFFFNLIFLYYKIRLKRQKILNIRIENNIVSFILYFILLHLPYKFFLAIFYYILGKIFYLPIFYIK